MRVPNRQVERRVFGRRTSPTNPKAMANDNGRRYGKTSCPRTGASSKRRIFRGYRSIPWSVWPGAKSALDSGVDSRVYSWMEVTQQGIQIGQVARQTGVSVDAIRFYEKQRLLGPSRRTEGGFRVFGNEDLQHIQFIRRAQELGFSLTEIRELIVLQGRQLEACSHVRDMLTTKLGAVRQKISSLRKLERQLVGDLNACEQRLQIRSKDHNNCPVLNALAEPASRRRKR